MRCLLQRGVRIAHGERPLPCRKHLQIVEIIAEYRRLGRSDAKHALQRFDALLLIGCGIHDVDPQFAGNHHLLIVFQWRQLFRGHCFGIVEIENRQFEYGVAFAV